MRISVLMLVTGCRAAGSMDETGQAVDSPTLDSADVGFPAPCGVGEIQATVGDLGYDSVGAAVRAAADGGAVLLCPGEHDLDEQIEIPSGANETIAAADAEAETSLNGGGSIGLFRLSPSSQLVLDHLVLRGGQAENGGAIAMESASLAVRDSVLTENRATGCGGAIDVIVDADGTGRGSSVTLLRTTVSENAADLCGGAFAVRGGGGIEVGTRFEMRVDHSAIYRNRSEAGGAVLTYTSGGTTQVLFEDSDVTENVSRSASIDVAATDSNLDVQFERSGLRTNAVSEAGGVVADVSAATGSHTYSFLRSEVTGNIACGTCAAVVIGPSVGLVSADTDWGAGADDNVPHDLLVDPAGDERIYNLGAAETFQCDSNGCTVAEAP